MLRWCPGFCCDCAAAQTQAKLKNGLNDPKQNDTKVKMGNIVIVLPRDHHQQHLACFNVSSQVIAVIDTSKVLILETFEIWFSALNKKEKKGTNKQTNKQIKSFKWKKKQLIGCS